MNYQGIRIRPGVGERQRWQCSKGHVGEAINLEGPNTGAPTVAFQLTPEDHWTPQLCLICLADLLGHVTYEALGG